MKKTVILLVCVFALLPDFVIGATRRAGLTNTVQNQTTASGAVTTARAGVRQATPKQSVAARSATKTVAQPKVTAARAATKQKVVNAGTKITSATENTVVSEECKTKYYGCMDSFCMLDNTNGGRCLCSDKNSELDAVLAEIEELDRKSYEMATTGVEKIEMGEDAADAIAKADAVAKSISASKSDKKRQSLDLWNTDLDFDNDDIFSIDESIDFSNKTGDALHGAVSQMCLEQIPECAPQSSMIKMMYAQQIKSDCTAYENSLKTQKNASAQKLATAQSALREAALEQHRAANEYDLGQCSVEFKKCMQTTGGCKDDWTGCVGIAASEKMKNAKKSKDYTISGTATQITIAASTYDTLIAKKPLCESVTKKCVKVKDKVWDTFLADVAPAVKSAELTAESDLRMNCISNISNCFQKACKDTIDPNDPDGSYDMCLTRPETMLNLCKVQIEPCLAATGNSMKDYDKSSLWNYVVARLSSMRVDSCTTEVKECLQSEDRCGKDYSGCIGLDTDTIMRMCPHEKMVGCQSVYGSKNVTGDEVYDEIATMVQGLMLNIDNNFLNQCQKALDNAMIKVCGDTTNCDSLVIDEHSGARSFKYQICKYSGIDETGNITWTSQCYDSVDAISTNVLTSGSETEGWAGKLSGIIYWGDISYKDTGDEIEFTTFDEYISKLEATGLLIGDSEMNDIKTMSFETEILPLESAINNAIKTIESDPTVQYCMTGRTVQGMRTRSGKTVDTVDSELKNMSGGARFPSLTKQIRMVIANSAYKNTKDNYNKKYDTEISRMMQDRVKVAERIDKKSMQDTAKQTCEAWQTSSTLPESNAPQKSSAGKYVGLGLLIAGGVVTAVLSSGTAIPIIAGSIAAAAAGTMAATSGTDAQFTDETNWNYKENVTTTFNETTGECTRIRTYQNCAKVKRNYCKEWEEPQEEMQKVNLY